jgi:UPF0042 nucleotide-binding protein
MVVSVTSFGFKYGVPPEADMVFDARFLPNPNFVPRLKRLTGSHPSVVEFLEEQPDTATFLRRLVSLLRFVLPRHDKEGRSYVTLAVGCTGGRHRSVMLTNALGTAVEELGYTARVYHRDVKEG